MTATPDQGLDLGAIRRRWIRSATAADYSAEGCLILTEHAFRDVPALIAEVERLRADNVSMTEVIQAIVPAHERACAERDEARAALDRLIRDALADPDSHTTKDTP